MPAPQPACARAKVAKQLAAFVGAAAVVVATVAEISAVAGRSSRTHSVGMRTWDKSGNSTACSACLFFSS